VVRDELILRLNEVKEVLNDCYGLPLDVIGVDEVHLCIIVPEMANPLIVVIYRRYIDQVVCYVC
jgi:hypothetical protein